MNEWFPLIKPDDAIYESLLYGIKFFDIFMKGSFSYIKEHLLKEYTYVYDYLQKKHNR